MFKEHEIIYILDEGDMPVAYRFEGIWPKGSSSSIDFSAVQLKPHGTNQHGEVMYMDRGFRFEDFGSVWVRELI